MNSSQSSWIFWAYSSGVSLAAEEQLALGHHQVAHRRRRPVLPGEEAVLRVESLVFAHHLAEQRVVDRRLGSGLGGGWPTGGDLGVDGLRAGRHEIDERSGAIRVLALGRDDERQAVAADGGMRAAGSRGEEHEPGVVTEGPVDVAERPRAADVEHALTLSEAGDGVIEARGEGIGVEVAVGHPVLEVLRTLDVARVVVCGAFLVEHPVVDGLRRHVPAVQQRQVVERRPADRDRRA